MFYDNLKQVCDSKKLKITPIVEECGGAKGSISNWKKGAAPNSDIVAKLSVRLNVSTDFLIFGEEKSPSAEQTAKEQLAPDEQELLDNYRKLSEHDKGKVIGKAETLAELVSEQQLRAPVSEPVNTPMIKIAFMDIPVSAGFGEPLDVEVCENYITVPDTPTSRRADFSVRVSGDSMEPEFSDGDILLVEKTEVINKGEIGIFVVDGSGYVKKYGKDRLISLNDDYEDIELKRYNSCCCQGRVIGKL